LKLIIFIVAFTIFCSTSLTAETLRYKGTGGRAAYPINFDFRLYDVTTTTSGPQNSLGSIKIDLIDLKSRALNLTLENGHVGFGGSSVGRGEQLFGGNYLLKIKSNEVKWSVTFKPKARLRTSVPHKNSIAGFYLGAAKITSCESTIANWPCRTGESDGILLEIDQDKASTPIVKLRNVELLVSEFFAKSLVAIYTSKDDFGCDYTENLSLTEINVNNAKAKMEINVICADGTMRTVEEHGILRRG
jgi:hypothetical protein